MLYLINFCSFPWWLAWLLPFLLGLLAGWAIWSKWKERVDALEADLSNSKSKLSKLESDLDFCKKDNLTINGKWNISADRIKELEEKGRKKEIEYNLALTNAKTAAIPKIVVDPSIEINKNRIIELESSYKDLKAKTDKALADLALAQKEKADINAQWIITQNRLKELDELGLKKDREFNLALTAAKNVVPIIDPSIEINKNRIIELESSYKDLKAKTDKALADLALAQKEKADINGQWIITQNRLKESDELGLKKDREFNLALTAAKNVVPIIDPSIEINKNRIIELESSYKDLKAKTDKALADLALAQKEKADINGQWIITQNRLKELDELGLKKDREFNLALTAAKNVVPIIDPSIEINKNRIIELESSYKDLKAKTDKALADLALAQKEKADINGQWIITQNRLKESDELGLKKDREFNLALTAAKNVVPIIDPSIEINKNRIIELESSYKDLKAKTDKALSDLALAQKDKSDINAQWALAQNRIKELDALGLKKEHDFNLALTAAKVVPVPVIDPSIEINKKRIIELEANYKDLKSKTDKIETDLGISHKDNASVQSSLSLAQARIKELEASLNQSNSELQHANDLLIQASNPTVDIQKYKGLTSDQLQIIEGIGPKMQQILNENKIFTWQDLSKHTGPGIKSILDQYGDKYNFIDPTTWPSQAALAADGKLDELITYQKQLDGGKEGSNDLSDSKLEKLLFRMSGFSSVKPDDLKIIEGIGPKIAQLLIESGISTWRQLANTSQHRLNEILQAGGNRFGLADPATWNHQANLAADGKWDELKTYQDTIG